MAQEPFFISVRKGSSATFGMTLLGSGPCLVSDVTTDGPAARAGVKAGFVVLEIDGKNVTKMNHTQVRELIREAETKEWIRFKFSTLEAACRFFGNDLRVMYEGSCSKKRRSGGTTGKKNSPRKSDPKIALSREEAKENGRDGPYQAVVLAVDPIAGFDPKKPLTPPRNSKPTVQPRFGPEVTRRSHVQQNRQLAQWMRSAEQQALNSPVLAAANTTPQTPVGASVEFFCLYYSNLVDLLGCMEESIFRKNVQYLRNYNVPPQFWARLVISDRRLSIYRPEGKYAHYSPKHMRDVFLHDDGKFFGFSTIRMSKVQGTSPTNTLETPQTMDVFSCHILCVDPSIRMSRTRQREVLTLLIGKDRALMKGSANVDACFPEDAIRIVDHLEALATNRDVVDEVKDVANLLSSNTFPPAKPPEETQYETEDATANFNSASGLRNSMRKYGPFGNLQQQRHSLSTDSLHTLPKRTLIAAPVPNRYSCIINGTNISDRSQTNIPATIGENEVLKTVSQTSTGTYDSLSSYEHDSAWTRDVSSSLDLTARTSTNVSFGDEGCFQEPIFPSEKADPWKLDLYQVLDNPKALNLFQAFLAQEHSQENISFWLECQVYRTVKKSKEMKHMAKKMFDRFLSPHAPESINVDSHVRSAVQRSLNIPTTSTFDIAAQQIFELMSSDSFPRFVRSPYYLQLRQLLEPTSYNINQSMPSLLEPDSGGSKERRQSLIFSWFKKKTEPDLDTSRTSRDSRQSLPVAYNNSPSDSNFQPPAASSPKNPLQKLIDKGRKSFSARVKPSKRESIMTFLSDSEIRTESEIRPQNASPVSFQFRKPHTPPMKPEVVLRRAKAPRSAARDQKRLSLQGLQRPKTKGVTEPTDWTFSRSSLDDCLDKVPVPPKPYELSAGHRPVMPSTGGRTSSQLHVADF